MKGLVYLNARSEQQMAEMNRVMALPVEQQRFHYYGHKMNTQFAIMQSWNSEDDRYIYVKQTKVLVSFGKKLYAKYAPVTGYALDTHTHSIKAWFGCQIKALPEDMLAPMMNHYKLEWLVDAMQASHGYKYMLNASILKRICKGKITNRLDLTKAFIKSSPLFAEARQLPFSTIVAKLNEDSLQITELASYLKVASSPEAFAVKYLTLPLDKGIFDEWQNPENRYYSVGHDLVHQAKVLGLKVNFEWSYKRAMEVHNEWTRQIMALEIDSVEDINYDYVGELPTPEGMKLLTTNREIFEEGTLMKHCVYTNHRHAIEMKKEFIFHGDFGNCSWTVSVKGRATGLRDTPVVYTISQMFGVRNSRVHDADRHEVEAWLAQEHVQAWFNANAFRTKKVYISNVNEDHDLPY